MACLEGVSADRIIRCRYLLIFSKLFLKLYFKFIMNLNFIIVIFFCRFCAQKWEGSSLVLGTMYAYDIFAAMPCCTERLKVHLHNIFNKKTKLKIE